MGCLGLSWFTPIGSMALLALWLYAGSMLAEALLAGPCAPVSLGVLSCPLESVESLESSMFAKALVLVSPHDWWLSP